MHIGIGFSKHPDTPIAIQEAIQQALPALHASPVDWGLCFFTAPHIESSEVIWHTLQQQTQCSNIAGGASMGLLSRNAECTTTPGVSVLLGSQCPQLQTRAQLFHQETRNSESVPQQLRNFLDQCQTSPLLCLFPDTQSQQPLNLINTLNYTPIQPDTLGSGGLGLQLGPQGIQTHALSAICWEGDFLYQVGMTHSSKPLGTPMFVTAGEGNIVRRLDNFAALDVFSTLASKAGYATLEEAVPHILVAVSLNKETPTFEAESCLVKNITGIDVANRGIEIPHIIQEGQVLSFMHRSPATAEQDLYDMLGALKEQKSNVPAFGLYLNHIARGSQLFDSENVEMESIHSVLGDFPLLGIFGGYELANTSYGLHLFNHTGVLLLFYDEPMP